MPDGYAMWHLFKDFVVNDAWDSPLTEEVIVVNIDSINSTYKGKGRPDMAKNLKDKVDKERPEDAGKDARFEVKFVTVEEYFKNCDRAGEFTEEEVAAYFVPQPPEPLDEHQRCSEYLILRHDLVSR